MKVHWTESAEAHLDAIYAYIAQNSQTYALRMVDRITQRSQQIAAFPLSGRRVPEYDIDQIREVFCGPYRLIYHIRSDQIDVLAVVHGAQNALREDKAEDNA
ncbi:type II toxin-antitoxin system RelE/ParE family toxin [Thiohalocapsa sp. ML1]|jgi:toxin ParE1/3/4|uniref:type II toxin-antitoxin system RelE/ParE family toxin n=1 Tax=Thiohalocapsa sp. ML1 TaxID=1431688 RepID=UPI000731FAC8|nr:type II toxin-antitoxin system RelE/ParE family toxin [Thiohalocapsa sp. ML1]